MSWPIVFRRFRSTVVLIGCCIASNAIIASAQAAGYGNYGCNHFGPYRSGYRSWGTSYSSAGIRYSVRRYGSYRQPFGSAHPRSLRGHYGNGYSYSNPYLGYTSSVFQSRFGGYFPYRTPTSTFRYGRSFGYPAGFAVPRYRVYMSQSVVPTVPGETLGNRRFVSTAHGQSSIPAEQGWILLSEGNAAQAVTAFDKRVSENPGNMLSKVGLALSFAAAGDLTAGAWHMRQACSNDVDVLKLVRLNDELTHQVEHLIGGYQRSLPKHSSGRQTHFMLASLNYLTGNKNAAATAISNAIRNGDRTAVAGHLQKLIKDFDKSQPATLVQY